MSQTLLKPEIQFSSACDDGSTTDFIVRFKFSTTTFPSDNQFTIELSAGDGTWGNPTNVGTITTENTSFTFDRSFQLPDDTFGTNYKIRLVASSPAMTSPDSDAFQAYKIVNGTFILNNFENVVLCEGESEELTLNTTQEGQYRWYKDGTIIATTTEPMLEVSEEGEYQVKIDYGTCGFKESTLINVVVFNEADGQIKGSLTVQICGDEAHTFEANVNDTSFTYDWYFNNNLVQSSNLATYTTPTAGQLGTYHLEVDTGSCVTTSDNVELKQITTADFNVNTVGSLKTILLPGETRELCITHDASSATMQWYKDTAPLAARTQLCTNATEAGEYFIRVTKSTSGSCNIVVDSDKYELIGVGAFDVEIRTETDYRDCSNAVTKLSIVGVEVTGEDGEKYNLSTDQIAMLNYQWNKGGVPIAGATQDELSVNSYLESDLYTLSINVGSKNGLSNELDVKLVEVPEVSSTTISNSLCAGGSITYTIDNVTAGYTYKWIKDGADDVTAADPSVLEVTEIGEYVLEYSGFGCTNELAAIDVVLFDDSAVTITPSEKVVMEDGGVATVIAAGGDSYEWYEGEDVLGALLSTTEELTVNTLGFYTVLVKVGACELVRTIEVVEPDDQVIVPNIVSPNQDGINDTWKLSNAYAFQPSVTIELYNSNGKEILKVTDYKNDWPADNLGNQKVFYYKIIKDDALIKAGTISILD
ncbi:T9SS type B sorting domain-containing protein [Tenacibaculum retecalamus]|uniref:T9SS type B sorting domain-containing protein n=1 Tax=Tenacibaculum retecalamus TaxID=3018315 RepID=UPI0023D90ACE|nr:gliding motility-associated C-terminal domain-containing protein [Tenacibaculum retecalamus]WBX70261.1 gliding motility-associated C-terminal domain-containing protein [Tenacibaculum retecalamus]